MSNLPTNYVDDVLNADVNTRRKYQMIQNGDGTVSLVDVTDYDTVGSSIGAAQINAQNTQINQNTEDISSLTQHLTEIERGLRGMLDFTNAIELTSSSNFITSKNGAIFGNINPSTAGGSLSIGGNATLFQKDIGVPIWFDGIPSGTSIVCTITQYSGYKAYYVPYLD